MGLAEEIVKYPKKDDIHIDFGTSGFRTTAERLDHVLFRMGMLAALRSRAKGSAAIGLMITASHNPEEDNGVKLIDPKGDMLEMSWESVATRVANASNEPQKVIDVLKTTAVELSIDETKAALVFIGRDTRPSSTRLAKAAQAGVHAMSGEFVDFGVVTTPLLHFVVNGHNTNLSPDQLLQDVYYETLTAAFKALISEAGPRNRYDPLVIFDGSNGVGALAINKFLPLLGNTLKVKVHNQDTSTKGKLNYLCGADYVKSQQKPPEGFDVPKMTRVASVDGDADRIVYSYIDEHGKFHLLDGDKIACLVAEYLIGLVRSSGLNLEVGVVQTAYSNANSTKYLEQILKVSVACVLTGVKHLHHKAMEFDIGVYFEANGHGTVLFSNNARNLITQAEHDPDMDKRRSAVQLKKLTEVINPTVGDALSDMLLVEAILHAKDWNIQDWEAMYNALPFVLMKVCVKDRNVIETTDAARRCTKPEMLQGEIDAAVNKYRNGRSFVRASGTEDVVRVYAEASTPDEAQSLAVEVAQLVHKFAFGVGPLPS